MRKYLASEIAKLSNDFLWQNLRGEFTLIFSDGEIETNYKETIYSAYGWRIFHLAYPNTPFLKKHHVKTIIKNGRLGGKTHLDLLGSMMWDTFAVYQTEGHSVRDELSRLIYVATNEMYNDLSIRLEEHVLSLDIIDFLEIIDHEDASDVLNKIEYTAKYISDSYATLTNLLYDPTKLINNPIAKAVKAGLVNKNQVLQCIGPVGFRTDIDSVIFPVPVVRGFVQGLRLLHDSLVESRSAAKSLYFSKDPLQDAEYFSRRLQLLCQIVENLHHTDCGSTDYLLWHVKPSIDDNGGLNYSGDLKHLVGKYYVDEETSSLKAIKVTDSHLYGKTIRLRSVIAGCNHPDPHGVCSVCFGELSLSVPENTNLGHMCSTSMTQKTSQSVLSVKHLDASSAVEGIVLNNEAKRFLETSADQESYLFKANLENTDTKLVFNSSRAIGLTDINLVENIEDLFITRVSEIDQIGIMCAVEGLVNVTEINVNINDRYASLTHDFLKHIKTKGWFVDEKNNYIIELGGWDFSKPIMTLPQKHYNMSIHSAGIATLIESKVDDTIERAKACSPAATIVELFDLVNNKLDINLAVLEIILYSAMIVSPEKNDYRLPKPWTEKGLGVASVIIPKRSLSAAFAYEYHRNTIVNPSSFFNEHRASHIMDAFVCPQEVVDNLNA